MTTTIPPTLGINKPPKYFPKLKDCVASATEANHEFVVMRDTPSGFRFAHFKDVDEYWDKFPGTDYHFYENISGSESKQYFDCEWARDDFPNLKIEDITEAICRGNKEYFDVDVRAEDIYVQTASGDGEEGTPYAGKFKHSYHLVVNKKDENGKVMYARSNKDTKELVKHIKATETDESIKKAIDESVYGPSQSMKLMYQTKKGSNRVQKPVEVVTDRKETFKQHLIKRYYRHLEPNESVTYYEKKRDHAQSANEKANKTQKNTTPRILDNPKKVKELLNKLPNDDLDWESYRNVMLACMNEGLTFDDFVTWSAKSEKHNLDKDRGNWVSFRQSEPPTNRFSYYTLKKMYDERSPREEEVELDEPPLRTDEVHANNILEFFEGKMYNTLYGNFMYDEDEGIWRSEEEKGKYHLKIIQKHSATLFPNVTSDDERKSFLSLYSNAYKLAWAKAPTKGMLPFRNARGYLLFDNGVLDMLAFEMKPFDPKYFFTKKIHRSLDPLSIERALKEQVVECFFNKPYTVPGDAKGIDNSQRLYPVNDRNLEKRDYFLETMGRAIALGGADKQYSIVIGSTNSGKGVNTKMTRNALGEFYQNFNTGNLLRKGKVMGEDERKWAWVVKIWDCRIAIGNEFEMNTEDGTGKFGKQKEIVPINCGMIKTLVSKGDEIQARLLYCNPITIHNQAYIFVYANDFPPVSGADEAFVERTNVIYQDRGSSPNITEENETHFPAAKDDTLDEFVDREDVANAYIAVMCEYYKRSVDHGKTKKPDSVKANIRDMVKNVQQNGFEWVRDKYEVYNKSAENDDDVDDEDNNNGEPTQKRDVLKDFGGAKTDKGVYRFDWDKVNDYYVRFETIYKWYINEGNTMSETQFGKLLTSHGIYPASKKIDGRTKSVRVGIRKPRCTYDDF